MTVATEKKSAAPAKLPKQPGPLVVQQGLEKHAVVPAPAVDDPAAVDQPAQRQVHRIKVSDETPYERYGETWILGHKKTEIDMTYAQHGLAWSLEHGGPGGPASPDPDYHLGICRNFAIENSELWCDAEFADDEALSEIAQRVKRDWASGDPTRPFVSVTMKPVDYELASSNQTGEMSTRRWVLWQPREIAVIETPAIAGTGSLSASGEEFEVHCVSEEKPQTEQEQELEQLETHKEATTMPETTKTPTAPTVEVGAEQMAARNLEMIEIENLCESHGLDKAFRHELISKGLSLEKAKVAVLDKLSTHGVVRMPSSESLEKLGVDRKTLKRYSYARAFQQSMERHSRYDGVEGDLHRLLEKSRPSDMQLHSGGILVPFETRSEDEIAAWEERRFERHTMGTNAPTKGMELVAQQTLPLVEMLQALPISAKLGAITNFLTGMASYPRVTGGPTVQFKGENSGDVVASDLVTGEILSKGRNTIGAVPLTRALLMQTSGAADSYAKRLLVEGETLVVDRAFFGGTGSGEQPLGLYNTPTVQTVAAGSVAPTYDIITQMLAKVARANAAFGTLGWVTTPEIAAKLMKTPEISAASAKAIWTGPIDDGQIAGYRAIASSQAPFQMGAGADEHCFAFGNWGLNHINRWGAVEVLVNPYSQALAGITLLHVYGLADTVFTQPQGMCVATAAKNA